MTTVERAIGTSDAVVEKFETDAAYQAARELVRSAWRSDPGAFEDGRIWQVSRRLFSRRVPGYAFGSWIPHDVIPHQVDRAFAVEEERPSGALVLVSRFRRNLGKIAESFRELTLLEALGFAQELVFVPGNLFLNEGINELWLLTTGGGGVAFNNANSQLGVGDSTVAAAATQTDLQAATNKLFKAMEAGFPTSGTLQKATFKSAFATGDANFAWQEWSVRNASTEPAAENLNRKVENLGTKASGTWTLTVDLSVA